MPFPRFHHDPNHPHTHGPAGPGAFRDRAAPLTRDFARRAFTVGIGGPVGSGKTALLLALCRLLRDDHEIAVVTNDIFTKEDAEFLTRHTRCRPSVSPPSRPAAARTPPFATTSARTWRRSTG